MQSRTRWLPFLFALWLFCGLAPSAEALSLYFRYPESKEALVNPYIGNVAWGDDLSGREQPFTLVYCDATWAQLEPQKGDYAFAAWEADYHIAHWRAEGKHVIFRLVLDRPGEKNHLDIPQWLYDEMGGDGEYYSIPYGRGFLPNYANPVLIEAHARLVRALGQRYGEDPLFSFVQLGSLGHWGEWHTYDTLPNLPEAAVREAYIAPYPEAFPSAYLMMRRPFTHARAYGMGLYNDAAGDNESTEIWLDWIAAGEAHNATYEEDGLALLPMPLAWQSAPVGGELSTQYAPKELIAPAMLEDTIRLFSTSHTSWIGPGSFVEVQRGGELQPALDALLLGIGYRLLISEITVEALAPDNITLHLTWKNTGNAPFYFDWQPSLRFSSEGGEHWVWALGLPLIEVLPGKPVEISFPLPEGTLSSGTYQVAVGIVNPQTGEAEVALAMDVPAEDGWYTLCDLSL